MQQLCVEISHLENNTEDSETIAFSETDKERSETSADTKTDYAENLSRSIFEKKVLLLVRRCLFSLLSRDTLNTIHLCIFFFFPSSLFRHEADFMFSLLMCCLCAAPYCTPASLSFFFSFTPAVTSCLTRFAPTLGYVLTHSHTDY